MDIKNDNSEIYVITIGDIRDVAKKEGFGNLGDEEIIKIADKLGDYISWHDAIVLALNDCLPVPHYNNQQNED